MSNNKALELAYLAGIERLHDLSRLIEFFPNGRSAQLIPAIRFYTFYIGARDMLVTFSEQYTMSCTCTCVMITVS